MQPLRNNLSTGYYSSQAGLSRPSASVADRGISKGAPIPQHRISVATSAWLKHVMASGSADHQYIAAQVLAGLSDGSLVKAEKAQDGDTRDNFAKSLPMGREGNGLLEAKATLNTEGMFDISEIGLQWESGKAMTFPLAEGFAEQTSLVDASSRQPAGSSAQSTIQGKQPEYQHLSALQQLNARIPYSVVHGKNQGVQCHLNISAGRGASIDNFIRQMLEQLNSKPMSDSRTADAVGILNLIKDDHNYTNNFHFMTCLQGQKPIGLMVAERMDRQEVYIHHVVADSDYPGTAKAMMKQAASMAIAHSKHGKLTVSPLNESVADNFERNYGFVSNNDGSDDGFDDEDDLVLRPAQSALWQCKVGGEAKLK